MPSRILIRKDGRDLAVVPLASPMTIGRHPGSSIQLEDTMMSREHARITLEGARVFVTDVSQNGVKLGGTRIPRGEPREVRHGDVLTLPAHELVFELDGGLAGTISTPDVQDPVRTRPPPSPNLEHLLEDDIPLWNDAQDVDLRVAEIVEETADVKTLRLVGVTPLLFSYRPGQFLTLKVQIEGKQKNRCYTISSSPSRPHTLEITVKRAPHGLVSNWLHDHVKLGDRLRVNGPAGDFSCFNYPSSKILCIAAGSGITPVMSMCRWIVDTRADVDVTVLLSFRTPSDIIFRRELELMSGRHNDLKIFCTVTARSALDSWTGLAGRVCSQMFQLTVPDLQERHVYLCGPNPFMDGVKDCLVQLGFPTQNLHTESFGKDRVAPGSAPREKEPAPAACAAGGVASTAKAAEPAAKLHSVTFRQSGVVARTDGNEGLLELALANGVGIPSDGCRMGSCLVCKVKKVSGEVVMEKNRLTPDHKSQGFVVTCVGRAQSDVVLEA